MNVEMIVTDLDNTLLNTNKNISDYTVNILNQCHQIGIKIVFATARTLDLVQDYLQNIYVDGLITLNGAVLYSGIEVIKRITFDNEIQRIILNELQNNEQIIKISGRTGELTFSTNPSNNKEKFTDFVKDILPPLSMISFRSNNPKIMSLLSEKYLLLNILTVTGENLFDILPPEATKWKGIQFISSLYKINKSSIISFGDDNNDIEMIKNCGIGIAVKNAINEVKKASKFICDSNDNDGVAKWIEENILKKMSKNAPTS